MLGRTTRKQITADRASAPHQISSTTTKEATGTAFARAIRGERNSSIREKRLLPEARSSAAAMPAKNPMAIRRRLLPTAA